MNWHSLNLEWLSYMHNIVCEPSLSRMPILRGWVLIIIFPACMVSPSPSIFYTTHKQPRVMIFPAMQLIMLY